MPGPVPLHTRVYVLACLLALVEQPAFAQTLGSGKSFDLPLGRIIAGLIICSLVALVAALLMRRYFGGRIPSLELLLRSAPMREAGRRVSVLETRRLSPHADICRFASAGREYLVLLSPNGATLLRESEVEPAPGAPEAPVKPS